MHNTLNLEIAYLADHIDSIPTIAKWIVDEWQVYDPTLNIERATKSLSARINKDQVPLSFVAFIDGELIGQVALKKGIVVPGYEYLEPWVGSLYVVPAHRGQNIAQVLLGKASQKAKSLGYDKLYLFTSIDTLPAWYQKLGWKIMARDQLHGNPVTLMEYELTSN